MKTLQICGQAHLSPPFPILVAIEHENNPDLFNQEVRKLSLVRCPSALASRRGRSHRRFCPASRRTRETLALVSSGFRLDRPRR